MPSASTIDLFVSRVEEGAHADAIVEFYTENSTMRENLGVARSGRSNHEAAERKVLARAKSVYSKCVRPVFVEGDLVVVRWIFRFEWNDGTVTEMEELAYQRWEGERIAEEQFFYDPAQLKPPPTAPSAA
jgi:ketosteroid isomerase-like protein